ncbi:MAG: DUF364 domain-containing protein [Microcystaceae cyanobacterium]
MINPKDIYPLLIEKAQSSTLIKEIIIGLTWTYCEAEAIGLAMSPAIPTRTLPWSGTLVNRSTQELATWLTSWESYPATIGMSVINGAINANNDLIKYSTPINPEGSANLAIFEHFLPQIKGKKVVVIGRYPNLSRYQEMMDMTVIERQPSTNDLPDPAAEYLIPDADWVFLTGTSIINKTFPRLVELAQHSQLVLMGPTVPWLSELKDMGIDYLAGVGVTDKEKLRQTVAEGGGVRIFETGVQYRVLSFKERF